MNILWSGLPERPKFSDLPFARFPRPNPPRFLLGRFLVSARIPAMKRSSIFPSAPFISAVLFVLLTIGFVSAQKKPRPPKISWKVQQLHLDNGEGCAVGDINGDGKLDVVAGEYWYSAPDFKQHKVRRLLSFGKDYIQNNSEYLYDVDGDGDLDVVAGAFTLPEINWYENPGAGKYDAPDGWASHLLANTATKNHEATFLHDINGDGTPEWLESSWKDDNPMEIYYFAKDDAGKPVLKRHTVAASGQGHGIGFGDINNDGKEDIIYSYGWYEQPAAGAFSGPWKRHHDFDLPHGSCPMLVIDLDEDGDNDIIWADGHNYGLYWEEQQKPQPDGSTTWRHHLIDNKFSQAHSLAWEDIDNDKQPELITGKRYHAHSGSDPGAEDKTTVHYYDWNKADQSWTKSIISQAEAGKGPGIGLQIRVADMDKNGWNDIIVPGKSGTHIIWNQGWTKPK